MKKVLALDRDEDINDLLAILITDAGYQAVTNLKRNSIEEITQINPDLIILDQTLNDLGGNLCLKIKKHSVIAHIPVILLSAFLNGAEAAAISHADAYISKPFDIWKVEKMVRTLMSDKKVEF